MVREVFAKRYADQYFLIEGESERHRNIYFELFNLFGDSIRAIEANGFQNIDDNHWLIQLLDKHTPNLEKLCFKKCYFKNVDDFLSRHTNITHLTLRNGSCGWKHQIQLPDYRNLKSLELVDFSHISKLSLEQVLLHNPQIGRLVLTFCDQQFTLSNMMALVCTHLKHLKDLDILDTYAFGIDFSIVGHMSFVIVQIPTYSLGMIYMEDFKSGLLERVSSDYKSIKHLELFNYHGRFNKGLIDAVGSFDQIETLSASYYCDQKQLEVIIENLPNLRCLSISRIIHRTNAHILSILSKCTHLEKIVIDSGRSSANNDDESMYRKNSHFHEEFIKAIKNQHITLELTENDEFIGIITKEQIIWRNKLLHWVGYDPIHSRSDLRLLDLATIPEGSTGKHKQPLNLIFNYLDLDGLYSFSMASRECKQLVHGYIYQRCKQSSKKRPKQRSIDREKFVLTDEFGMNYNGLRMFGKNIRYLEVQNIRYLDYSPQGLLKEIETYCKLLTKLCFHTRNRIDPHTFILPQVRHFVFYGYGEENLFHCDLSDLSEKCPNLEILEIRTVAKLYTGHYKKGRILFKNLQMIKFKPFDDSQVEYAKDLFKNSGTEVVIDC
ncbi:uncharacterized protein LOC129579733 [Sitodiplosis mosellana]|uniref:uncharacterized protein LOC129579733 n=1 Tax=Sitodiplosis mosellana TaxID=263140 RepID=UPI002443EB48|nr:uncharacterized protein LOC129579733 [Sitodiplosis mosellana]